MQAQTHNQKYDSMQLELMEMRDQIKEIKEQAACRLANEMDILQDQNKQLFTAWSEGLKEELQERQGHISEHAQGDQQAFEMRLRQLGEVLAAGLRGFMQPEDGKMPTIEVSLIPEARSSAKWTRVNVRY